MSIFLLPSIIYFISLIFFLLGLRKEKSNLYNSNNSNISVSIILCVRNGEHSLNNILSDLHQQNYNGKLEFIIVDDNSIDNTKKIIENYTSTDSRFRYISSTKDQSKLNYKKKALNIGIDSSKYDWLLFTDVDCRVEKNWVLSMTSNYLNNNYIIGYSKVLSGTSLVSQFQSIDFSMLMFSACSSTLQGLPLACSGQNQSYKKSLFKSVGGFEKITHLLQGDDSIFLQLCYKSKLLKTTFALNNESFVIAKTHHSWKDFFLQRIRWAGDANLMWKYNRYFFIIIISTFLINFFSCYLVLRLFFDTKMLFLTICIISIKFLLEFLIYFFGSLKFNNSIRILSFVIWFILQIPYVVLMGILSFFANQFKWQGRAIEKI